MSPTTKYGHWFLLTSVFLQAMLLGHMASVDYALGRAFGFARAYPRDFWFSVLGGSGACLLGLVSTGALLLRHPRSRQLAGGFCFAAITFLAARALMTIGSSDWWFVSEVCLLPAAVLVYLPSTLYSSKLNTDKVTQLS